VYPRAKGGTDSSSPLPFYPLFWEEGSRKKPEFLRTASRQQLKSSKNPAHHPKRRGEGIDGRGTNEAGTSIGGKQTRSRTVAKTARFRDQDQG
jgi:hypothetical protein